jgi:phenylacetate-CoA ligase
MAAPVREPACDGRAWLDGVVAAAVEGVAFYRRHNADAGCSGIDSIPSFDKSMTAGYGRFPVTVGGAVGAYRVLATSGTTGDRLFVAFDRGDWDRVGAWLARVGATVGMGPRDVLLNTHCYGLWVGGPVLDLLAQRAGACVVPLGPVSPTVALELLRDGVGTAISATPSYLRRLIEASDAGGLDLARTGLRLGFIGAEAAEPALREKILSRLPDGFRWVELYGLTETCGPSVAFAPDPAVPELVLNTRDFLVEVLDAASDRPVAPGAVGELTLTTRHAEWRTPLIRYRTRDLVRVTGGDPQAPTRISQVLGRADDSLKVGGVLMYPSAVAQIISSVLAPSAEWRGTAYRNGPECTLVVHAEASAPQCRDLEHLFAERIGMDATVVPVDGAHLSRSRDKTRRIVVETLETPEDVAAASGRPARPGC